MSCNSEQNLLKADYFVQNMVCRLPASILTAAFVAEKVESAATQALLGDLHRPHSRLFAVQGFEGVHVFD